MIVKPYHYDPLRDNTPVSQTGYINLNKAFESHTIPSVIDDVEVAYNEIEDPSAILGKPSDVFEAYRMAKYINEAGQKENSGESVVANA